MMDLETILASYGTDLLLVAGVLLLLLAGISLKIKKPKESIKEILFVSIVLTTLIPTIYLAGATVYLNTVSLSGGPVHWHAGFEVWDCGEAVDLIDPKGWSNKIGTPTLHEHNDKRIHLEGVVVRHEDSSLGKFFRVTGGAISDDLLVMRTNTGAFSLKNGDMCPQGEGKVQVFVYQTDKDQYYSQKKVQNPQNYLISHESQVPAGDCIIVEFDTPKDRTDKLCRSYKVAEKIGKLKGERK